MSAGGEVDLKALFERAREADLEAIAGTPLFRTGRRIRGECPLCGRGKGKRAGGPFWIDPDRGIYGCFGCAPPTGDAVSLEQALRGGSAREAAERLAGPAPRSPLATRIPPPRARKPVEPPKLDLAARLWREAAPAAGSPVEAYLRGRGICGPVLDFAMAHLRFNPSAWWGDGIKAPAMVGGLRAPGGATGGVHLTYLARVGEGWRKARLDPAKRMFGPQVFTAPDGAVSPGGVWLSPADAPGPLIVGEGIESTLSAAMLIGAPCRMVATLSLRALQGGWRTDQWGRLDPSAPSAAPDRAAFTWPAPKHPPWGEVVIAVDRDMRPVTVKVRRAGGGTAQRELDSEARARLCGALASQHWRAAGANRVRVIAPQEGRDFNDELLARREG